jgi:hypothetical protein
MTPGMKSFLVSFIIIFILIGALLFWASLCQESSYSENFSLMEQDIGNDSKPSAHYFHKTEGQNNYNITYGWEDYQGNPLRISFSYPKRFLAEAEEEFGYYQEEMDEYINKNLAGIRKEAVEYLRKKTLKFINDSEYSDFIFIEDSEPEKFDLKLSVPYSHAEEYEEIKAEFNRITHQIADEQEKYFRKIEKEQRKIKEQFLEMRLLRFVGDHIGVHYTHCVQKNRPRVKDVMEVMKDNNKTMPLQKFLALMLAFIQEIRFEIPPIRENDKYIGGFWVPPRVIVDNKGDCDSKGVTFASLWRNFKSYPLIIIRIPNHMFLGVAIPTIGENVLVINGLRYTLCEVTGPEKIPPGIVSNYSLSYLKSRNYVYEIIN